MSKERKEFFKPGTITLQYIDDDCRCVGLVVGDEWAEKKLGKDQLELFQKHFDGGSDHESYVCLVLGWFPDHSDYWKMFGNDKLKRFPNYIAATKRVATPSTLVEELTLFRFHQEQRVSRGLNSGKLQSRIFGFNGHQSETLEIVAIVQHYLSGGLPGKLPEWTGFFFEPDAEKIFSELEEVIPLGK